MSCEGLINLTENDVKDIIVSYIERKTGKKALDVYFNIESRNDGYGDKSIDMLHFYGVTVRIGV